MTGRLPLVLGVTVAAGLTAFGLASQHDLAPLMRLPFVLTFAAWGGILLIRCLAGHAASPALVRAAWHLGQGVPLLFGLLLVERFGTLHGIAVWQFPLGFIVLGYGYGRFLARCGPSAPLELGSSAAGPTTGGEPENGRTARGAPGHATSGRVVPDEGVGIGRESAGKGASEEATAGGSPRRDGAVGGRVQVAPDAGAPPVSGSPGDGRPGTPALLFPPVAAIGSALLLRAVSTELAILPVAAMVYLGLTFASGGIGLSAALRSLLSLGGLSFPLVFGLALTLCPADKGVLFPGFLCFFFGLLDGLWEGAAKAPAPGV